MAFIFKFIPIARKINFVNESSLNHHDLVHFIKPCFHRFFSNIVIYIYIVLNRKSNNINQYNDRNDKHNNKGFVDNLLKGKHYYLIPAYDFHETFYASR